ncbi:hypothetical protein [Gordonia sihwensis]|uniref:hypothetical protein n=1 Tax=Gordonia sihwensis TaxID=173559 RepID=UPI003D99EF36
MNENDVTITAVIDGRRVGRDEVLAWEARRIPRVSRKLGMKAPSGPVEGMRRAFCDGKFELGVDEIRRRLARDVRLSDAVARVTGGLSGGRRATSVCDLYVEGGDAQGFVDWFSDAGRDDYAWSMVVASPDHFIIDSTADGRQEVIETTGGSPFATRFFVDYDDTSRLTTARDPAFALELAGVALTGADTAVGGVRHQLRDDRYGFHLRACVEFPKLMAPQMVKEHRWHLACEFSNWIEGAFSA